MIGAHELNGVNLIPPGDDIGRERDLDALVRNAEIDANKITVEVQGSKAILKGTVRAWAEKEEAARVAWSAPGITSVENRITVEI